MQIKTEPQPMQDPVRQSTHQAPSLEPSGLTPDLMRQTLLARMGIQSWQLRRPALLGGHTAPDNQETVTPAPARDAPSVALAQPELDTPPAGKLWILAPRLPAPTLLADLCQLLGIAVDEVTLLTRLPAGHRPPQLWLELADPAWPDALVCPLTPTPAQKRALWQQLRSHLG